ncbi:hypothetical protein H6F75_27170 [Nodosilinea sp. FACHB-131]|uniref:hypothetical protein n=1 Tax=Leptolyngbya subtilissima TaxID=1346803 RepID=UPI0019AB51E9|nr:hypothetical protein [Nodosilinea sp. FACHB-131]MBD2115236.1 hypothetical protein [Nodosilinea sp. FACHB-141]
MGIPPGDTPAAALLPQLSAGHVLVVSGGHLDPCDRYLVQPSEFIEWVDGEVG